MATPPKPTRSKPAGRDQRRPASAPLQDGAKRVSRASVARRSDSAQTSRPKTGAMRQVKAPRPPLSPQDLLALYRPDLHQELLASSAPLYRYTSTWSIIPASSSPTRHRFPVTSGPGCKIAARRSFERQPDARPKTVLASSFSPGPTARVSRPSSCATGNESRLASPPR